jgi:NAD(P)-dependent dehydrogenase (short-subunit alcohol dehydrogenase family)
MSAVSRIAVVTGAGSGIGRAVAQALHEAGYSVVLAGRRAEALAETAAGSKGSGELLVVPTDVTDADSVARLFATAVTRFGRVDLLFNNAGVTAPSLPLDELPVEVVRNVVDVNLYGSMLCAREAMRVMKAQRPQGGRIINNGSISAYAPRRHSTPYATTKTAITGMTKSIGLDGRDFNIACCQIDIGNAATDLSEKMLNGVLQADGRVATEPRMAVEHVARAVVHMASLPPDANIPFVTIMATNMPLYGRG